jgi:hypothetical protein
VVVVVVVDDPVMSDKRKRPRKSPAPKRVKQEKKKAKPKKTKKGKRPASTPIDPGEATGPIFVRPADGSPIHPALEEQVRKPFLRSIYIDPQTRSIRYPLANGQRAALMDGLHKRMRYRFFRGIKLDNARPTKAFPKRLRSSADEGSRADEALAEAIRTGQAPPAAHHKGASEYASAVWTYWREHHHRPVLAQLPVIITHAMTATAGDYFTVHRNPFTGKETLCLFELKTGYPKTDEDPPTMTIPMPKLPGQDKAEEVPLTSVNRYYLQVLLTQMAYERELGLRIDGTVRVINVYKEREDMPRGATVPTYTCKVRVIGPEHLDPPGWPNRVIKDALYAAIRKQKAPKPQEPERNPWMEAGMAMGSIIMDATRQ